MAKILIVEDERRIAEPLATSLRSEGHECEVALDGPLGLRKARELEPDLVILDVMMPGLDGLSVCRKLRETSQVPVLMLTARDGESDEVLGLEVGADDYVTKPFSLQVLKSRIRSLLRRSARAQQPEEVLEVGPLHIDLGRHQARLAGELLDLTSTEFQLLAFLARQPGRVFTREQLLENIWGYEFEAYRRTVDTHMNRLRKKIEADPRKPEYLLTVYKVGYKFREAP